MLAIRLQRQGHKGYPVYRIIIQEAQRTPSSGKVVAYVGTYNPHTKENKLDVEKIKKYLGYGAKPTPRVIKLLIENKVKLPDWVEKPVTNKAKKTRFADKLRKNQPKEEAVAEEKAEEAPVEPAEVVAEEEASKVEAGPAEEALAEEKPAE